MKHDWSEHTLTRILFSCHNPDMSNLIQRTTELAMHIISTYVHTGDIVIDGGAYDGGTSRDCASVAGASGKVYAFEMDEEK